MTSASSPPATRTSPLVWAGMVVLALLILLVAFAGQDDATIGTTGDPEGTGRTGLLALRLLVDETGGETAIDIEYPTSEHDVAIIALPVYLDVLAGFGSEDGEDRTEEIVAPLIDWAEAGGTLIVGVDLLDAPASAFAFVDEDETVGAGVCTIDALQTVNGIRALPHNPVEIESGDEGCFGDESTALVVRRPVGTGEIVRLATADLMYNQSLDDAENAAMMARLMRLAEGRSVAFLSGPQIGLDGVVVPVNEDGEPVGAGDATLVDLVPSTVFALLVGLGGAFLIYALSRGRRLGSPVEEPQPIELPSSSYTEAVGRLFARAEDPLGRSAAILRHDFRTAMSRRVGLGADASADELARALAIPTGLDPARLASLIEGPPPADEDGLVALANDISEARDAMTHGRSSLVTAMKGTTE